MIQVACIDILQLDDDIYSHLYEVASEPRKLRANRYLQKDDKIRCVAADALLRFAVKQTLNITDFTVDYHKNGKPYLKYHTNFHFNLSHSGRWVVIAYGSSPVGIDVQECRAVCIEGITKRFFTADEQTYVFNETEGCMIDRFLRVWTGKESYVKFDGLGLRRSLDSFSVFDQLPVNFYTTFLNDACMTLCTTEVNHSIVMITPQQLLNR